jgi:hypothetical protein
VSFTEVQRDAEGSDRPTDVGYGKVLVMVWVVQWKQTCGKEDRQ